MVQNAWFIWHPKHKLAISPNPDSFITLYLGDTMERKDRSALATHLVGGVRTGIGSTETKYRLRFALSETVLYSITGFYSQLQ